LLLTTHFLIIHLIIRLTALLFSLAIAIITTTRRMIAMNSGVQDQAIMAAAHLKV